MVNHHVRRISMKVDKVPMIHSMATRICGCQPVSSFQGAPTHTTFWWSFYPLTMTQSRMDSSKRWKVCSINLERARVLLASCLTIVNIPCLTDLLDHPKWFARICPSWLPGPQISYHYDEHIQVLMSFCALLMYIYNIFIYYIIFIYIKMTKLLYHILCVFFPFGLIASLGTAARCMYSEDATLGHSRWQLYIGYGGIPKSSFH